MATRKRRRGRSRPDDQLAEYRRKRDFSRTREPAGDSTRRRRARLAFVIQKHAASHLHYDLRLELDGVMKSWAVPRGPSLDPSSKRLAMQVEDHPIEYNTFEGTIPQGEYGGGTVMLWDRGTYSPDEPAEHEDDAGAVRRGLHAGKLSFTFHGERLHGSYALVRTARGPKPKWLLIKHRDEQATAAIDITQEVRTSVATGRTMDEIAGESKRVWRSNRHGTEGGEQKRRVRSAATITPMMPKPMRTLPEAGDWTFEPWRGGERVLAYGAPDGARLLDDDARDVSARHEPIARELTSLAQRIGHGFVVEGEIVGAAEDASLFISDLLVAGPQTLVTEPWRARRAALERLLRRRRLRHSHRPQPHSDGASLLRRARLEGWAGIFARNLDSPYRPGARSDGLLRIATH